MSKYLSLSNIFCVAIITYIIYSIYSFSQIFIPPTCTPGKTCVKSYLHNSPQLDLCIFMSQRHDLAQYGDIKLIEVLKNFEYKKEWERKLVLDIPEEVRRNGSLFLHMIAAPSHPDITPDRCSRVYLNPDSVSFRIPLTQLHVPESYIFNLLQSDEESKPTEPGESEDSTAKPVTHLKSKVTFNMLTDPLTLPREKLPIELHRHLRMSQQRTFLPILVYNFLETKLEDLKLMKSPTEEVLLKYAPAYFGKLCFVLHLKEAMAYLRRTGFSTRDIDDIKGIFAGTNLYLLSLTIIITSIHLVFDFLAFKNDVNFWRKKSTIEGLSFRTVLWRAFSQAVICLYLIDEKASNILMIPSGIATVIEFWKVFKVVHRRSSKETKCEMETNKYDAECMRYLSYILYPLCIVGAVYSLFYQPHKSWYSWCLNSLVNGVYAFGFLFMLPQLFINYRLKSVAALPWKAFMYKAFNTFIDDVFAFIITMPTAHRVACFRDDVIFVIYLYQRWLYPVDKSRQDEDTAVVDEGRNENEEKKMQ